MWVIGLCANLTYPPLKFMGCLWGRSRQKVDPPSPTQVKTLPEVDLWLTHYGSRVVGLYRGLIVIFVLVFFPLSLCECVTMWGNDYCSHMRVVFAIAPLILFVCVLYTKGN